MRRAGVALALVCVLAGGARRVAAQPSPGAQQLYKDGQAFFDAGKYDEAIAKWKEAYLLSDEPLLLFNLGQAYRLKGECAEARVHYERYLAKGTKLHSKAAIEQKLAECEKANREKQVTGDRKPETGDAGNGGLTPGSGSETGSGPGPGSGSGSETVSASGSVAVAAAAEPGKKKKALALAVGATGVVLTLTGVVFGVMARNDKDELEEADGEWDDDLQSLEDRQARNAVLAPIFIGAGLAAVAGGAVLYWMGRREAAEASTIGAAPAAGGGVVVYTGAF